MEIVPLGPGFAAELRGVTLAEIAADDAAYKEARAALEQHSVIVFRSSPSRAGSGRSRSPRSARWAPARTS